MGEKIKLEEKSQEAPQFICSDRVTKEATKVVWNSKPYKRSWWWCHRHSGCGPNIYVCSTPTDKNAIMNMCVFFIFFYIYQIY